MIGQMIFSLLLLGAIFGAAFNLEVVELGIASNLNALMIVLGGTLAATLMAYPAKKMLWTLQLVKKSFGSREEVAWTIETLVNLARIFRKGGIRALEQQGNSLPSGMIKTGVELITYHYNREKIDQIIHKEALCIYGQYETAHKILINMARLAPALGLAGTIINLIRIFDHIQNPQSLIGYMAIALLSTFYGVVLANLCFVPLSNKLKEFMDQDELRMELIQEGILDLYDQEHPRAIKYKLETLSGAMATPHRSDLRPQLVLVSPHDYPKGAQA
ncbi:MAG: MotA/TolQ/ExbB proton channel family protein [Deltaproteobacteria bacterium]|nr:MotA/TolQ/ExbB proton channel family protein [Deltaproteobacteria bacterium]